MLVGQGQASEQGLNYSKATNAIWPLMPLQLASMPLSKITVWPWIVLMPFLNFPFCDGL